MIRRFLAAAALVLSLAGFTPGEQSTNIYYATQFAGAVSKQLCTWDATHDVADCINAAIAAANQAGGGIVELPAGTYGMSVPIPIAASNIGLRCNHTALKWLGAAGARMVSLISPYGDTTKKRLVGNSIVGCEFQGNGAADGLYMSSITGWDLRNLTFRGPFNGGKVVAFDAIPALEGSTFGETTSLQNGTLRGLWLDNSTGTSTGIYLGAYMTGVGAHGNASYFQIDDYVVIGNTSMTGIHAWGADNIRFGMGRVFNHGGIGVDMDIGVLTTLVTTGTTDSTISVSVASTAGLSIGRPASRARRCKRCAREHHDAVDLAAAAAVQTERCGDRAGGVRHGYPQRYSRSRYCWFDDYAFPGRDSVGEWGCTDIQADVRVRRYCVRAPFDARVEVYRPRADDAA